MFNLEILPQCPWEMSFGSSCPHSSTWVGFPSQTPLSHHSQRLHSTEGAQQDERPRKNGALGQISFINPECLQLASEPKPSTVKNYYPTSLKRSYSFRKASQTPWIHFTYTHQPTAHLQSQNSVHSLIK